ncbi:hypothetical protein GCM10027290_52480 [Micromonospora sonneratiae]
MNPSCGQLLPVTTSRPTTSRSTPARTPAPPAAEAPDRQPDPPRVPDPPQPPDPPGVAGFPDVPDAAQAPDLLPPAEPVPLPEEQPTPPSVPEPEPSKQRASKRRSAAASVSNTRRWLLVAAAVVVLLGIGVAFSQGVATPTGDPTSPSKLPSAGKLAESAPEVTNLHDERVAVTLAFADRTEGKAAFYVVGGPVGLQPTTLAEAPRGSTSVRINAVNPEVDYCFVVVAVLSVDQVAPSVQVCTARFGTAKP